MKIAERRRETALDEVRHHQIHRDRALEQHLHREPTGAGAGGAALGAADRPIGWIALVRVRRLHRHVAEVELRNRHRFESVRGQPRVAMRIHALGVHLYRHDIVVQRIASTVRAIERRELHRVRSLGWLEVKCILHQEIARRVARGEKVFRVARLREEESSLRRRSPRRILRPFTFLTRCDIGCERERPPHDRCHRRIVSCRLEMQRLGQCQRDRVAGFPLARDTHVGAVAQFGLVAHTARSSASDGIVQRVERRLIDHRPVDCNPESIASPHRTSHRQCECPR